jgi:hypothetical protein
MKLPHHERRECPVGAKVGAEQGAAGLDPPDPQNVLEECRRHVQHGDRLARERQHSGQAFEGLDVTRHREVTRCSPRGHPKLGQVNRQSLLQLTRAAGSHQGWPRRTTADVDEEAGTIRLRARTGKCGRRGPRPACFTNSGNEDDPTVHRPAGLA